MARPAPSPPGSWRSPWPPPSPRWLDADRAEIPLLDYDPTSPVVAAVAKLADKLGALKL